MSTNETVICGNHMLMTDHFFEKIFFLIRNAQVPVWWGYLALVISVLAFGSNSLPIKKFDIADGLFYQLNVCSSIFTVGLVANCFRYFPRFYFLPMIGGFCWCTASLLSIPSIKIVGLGVSYLISGIVSILTGWANARFGLAGTKPEQPKDVLMNYFGVVFCAISVVFFVFVKNESMTDQTGSSETEPLISSSNQPREQFFNDINATARQFIGIVITIVSGFLFAVSYIPYLYVIDNYENASDNGLDYVFSMYSGIFIASMMFFTIYSIIKKNKPFVNAQAILPGFASGFLWGTANCCFLFANSVLSQTVTFPIAGSIPPIVASFYGIFLFKEIKGAKNFLILSFGFLFTLVGSILCGLSK